jgi:uncharacterized protein (TIGR03437 family)
MRRSRFVFLIFLLIPLGPLRAQITLNLSHDLVAAGIASQNMTPNSPALDSQPLFLAALQYIQNNPVQFLTADPGAYYFLTPSSNTAVYVYFPPLSTLTIDFQGSTLYFKDGIKRAFDIENCRNLTFENFTIDYLFPPYTQVQLIAVDPVGRTFTYSLMPGWPDPKTFTTTPEFGDPELLALFFRNGAFVPGTGLTIITYPIGGNTLSAAPSDSPWTQSPVLSTLRPGDVVVVADDIGGDPLDVVKCDSMLFTQIETHGGIGGINLFDTSNTTLDHIRVVPRPGALLGSATGGLMFYDPPQNDHIRNSYVTRTMDDALGMGADPPAVVVSQPGPRQLVVDRNGTDHLPDGTPVSFVPIGTAAELSGGMVTSQDPPDTLDDVVNQVRVTLTFDRDLPALTAGDQVFYASPNERGSGSTIEDNLVENIGVGRGIYLGGLENVVVQRNVIRGTSNAGINVGEVSYVPGGGGAPSHGITIQNNAIENVLGPQAAGSGGIGVSAAAILVDSLDKYFDFVTQPVNTEVSILNNFVVGSGRTGIWIGELDGGQVSGNFIAQWNQHPELQPEGVNPFPGDFAQPLVLRFSQNVNNSGNVAQMNSTVQSPVSLNPASASPPAAGANGSFAVQTNLANFGWAASSDSSWITVTSGGSGAGNGTVQYSVTPNNSTSQRSGSVTVAGVEFVITQAPPAGPAIVPGGILNAASFATNLAGMGTAVAPGSLVTIYGSNLGTSEAHASGTSFPSSLGGVSITFNGVPSSLRDVVPAGQFVNAQVPFEVAPGAVNVVATVNGVTSQPQSVTIVPSAPGIFTVPPTGQDFAILVFSDPNSPHACQCRIAAPASASGVVGLPTGPIPRGANGFFYATGLGEMSPPVTDGNGGAGAIHTATDKPAIWIGNGSSEVQAVMQFAGQAPGFPGVYQVNIQIPSNAPTGDNLMLWMTNSAGSFVSNRAKIAIQ